MSPLFMPVLSTPIWRPKPTLPKPLLDKSLNKLLKESKKHWTMCTLTNNQKTIGNNSSKIAGYLKPCKMSGTAESQHSPQATLNQKKLPPWLCLLFFRGQCFCASHDCVSI